jgi:small subunit ribosomal protein S9
MSTDTPVASPAAFAADVAQPVAELTLGQAPAEGAVEVAADPQPVFKNRGKLDRFGVAMGTGRRKTAVARVRMKPGNGQFVVNGRPFVEYFCNERDRNNIEAVLKVTEKLGLVDISVRIDGGGTTGQTGAVVMALSRALEAMNPTLHTVLSEHGFLTRDSRMVERKKYGLKKARRSFQFSKR